MKWFRPSETLANSNASFTINLQYLSPLYWTRTWDLNIVVLKMIWLGILNGLCKTKRLLLYQMLSLMITMHFKSLKTYGGLASNVNVAANRLFWTTVKKNCFCFKLDDRYHAKESTSFGKGTLIGSAFSCPTNSHLRYFLHDCVWEIQTFIHFN